MIAAADVCCEQMVTDAPPAAATSAAGAPRAVSDVSEDRRCFAEAAVSESPLRRDAFAASPIVGRVVAGERLASLDFIDRRLRVLGRMVFDGGHWRRVRGERGDVGWLPADRVRAASGSCDLKPGQSGRLRG
jgi:hypothetical protein